MNELLCFNQKWNILDIVYTNSNTTIYKASRINSSFIDEVSIVVILLKDKSKKELIALSKLYEIEIEKMISMKSASNIVSIDDYEIINNKRKKQIEVYIRCNSIQSITKLDTISTDSIWNLGISLCNIVSNANMVGINNLCIKYDKLFVTKFHDFEISTINIENNYSDNIVEIGFVLFQLFNGGKEYSGSFERPIYSTVDESNFIKEILNKKISTIKELKDKLLVLKNNNEDRIIKLDNNIVEDDLDSSYLDSTMSIFDDKSISKKDESYYDMTQSIFSSQSNDEDDSYLDSTKSIFDSKKE